MGDKCYIVKRSERAGHEQYLHFYGLYDEYDDAHKRMMEVAESIDGPIERVEDDYVSINLGLDGFASVGIKELERNTAIEYSMCVRS